MSDEEDQKKLSEIYEGDDFFWFKEEEEMLKLEPELKRLKVTDLERLKAEGTFLPLGVKDE